MLSAKQEGFKYHFLILVWLDRGLNHGLPDHWWTLSNFKDKTLSAELRYADSIIHRGVKKTTSPQKKFDFKLHLVEIWEEWNTLSLPLLWGPLKPEMVEPVKGPSLGQIDLVRHYSNSIRPCTRKKEKKTLRKQQKNRNMNVKSTLFPNFLS